jgi:hypothetical protein
MDVRVLTEFSVRETLAEPPLKRRVRVVLTGLNPIRVT